MNNTVNFAGFTCTPEKLHYGSKDGRIAIRLNDTEDGSPVATATVNVPGYPIAEDETIIKDYSENEGIAESLVDAGVVELTGRHAPVGYNICPIARVLI